MSAELKTAPDARLCLEAETRVWTARQRLSESLCSVPAAPGAPSFLAFSEVTSTTLNVSWGEPLAANGVLQGYRVVYEPLAPVQGESGVGRGRGGGHGAHGAPCDPAARHVHTPHPSLLNSRDVTPRPPKILVLGSSWAWRGHLECPWEGPQSRPGRPDPIGPLIHSLAGQVTPSTCWVLCWVLGPTNLRKWGLP